ncbi:serine hydrolase domain-containing protein [Actinoplanes palleronii]|uniref:Serine hydrolase n=1 Tax=Actinoplanes palleronii TaxID=113570 RepID=A0ABQ4BGW2_9ACTN|nr:serine hydrolase domain-containing protein [Actinoplanes palleronii]GIE69921.1 serine hydrolase [Actinoplanes palleronii]
MRAAIALVLGLVTTIGVAGRAQGAAPQLPALDPALLGRAVAGLPNPVVTGAQLTVSGSAGQWSGRAGVADVTTGAPMPAGGRFRIASVTKAFTAVIALQLVAEHRLDLRQSVQHYLPGVLPGSYPPITVGQLLDHTSGLPFSLVDAQNADPAWVVAHRFDYWTPAQVVASAVAQPLAFAPGTEQRYNGVNYFLTGLIIEKVGGHSYAEELDRRIVKPLGLRATSLPAPGETRIPGPHAHGYVTVGGALVDVTEQSAWGWAESGIISSTADLTRFLSALLGGRLLPRAQLAPMLTLPDVPYPGGGTCRLGPHPGQACFSAGLQATTFPDGVTVWGKSGAVPGYTTGVFATADLARVMASSLNPTGNRDGSEARYVQNIAAAAFDPSLFAD